MPPLGGVSVQDVSPALAWAAARAAQWQKAKAAAGAAFAVPLPLIVINDRDDVQLRGTEAWRSHACAICRASTG